MKKLKLNLKGAKALNKVEQRQINGGEVYEACDQTIRCIKDDDCYASCKCQDYLPNDKRCK